MTSMLLMEGRWCPSLASQCQCSTRTASCHLIYTQGRVWCQGTTTAMLIYCQCTVPRNKLLSGILINKMHMKMLTSDRMVYMFKSRCDKISITKKYFNLTLPMVEMEYSGFGCQYHACLLMHCMAPEVISASAGMVFAMFDGQVVLLFQNFNFIYLSQAKSKIRFKMWMHLL